jgi:pSer/pThr/pTyr-binding forkhead associated (FHA) protein
MTNPPEIRAELQMVHSADPTAQGARYPVDTAEVTLGREPSCTVVIRSEQASRRHARITLLGSDHVLSDLGSTNGTFVNARPVQEQPLRNGDVIRIASTVLKYVRLG